MHTVLQPADFVVIAIIVLMLAGNRLRNARQAAHLRRLERKVDALLAHHRIEPPGALSEATQLMALDPTQKIAAIKRHRHETGLGLAEAKADVENFLIGKR